MSHSALKISSLIKAKLVVLLLAEGGGKKVASTPKKIQPNEKLRLAEPPLEKLISISSDQTKMTVSGDTPPHIAL